VSILTPSTLLALLATAGALVTGIASTAHGGDFDRHLSHQLVITDYAWSNQTGQRQSIPFLMSARPITSYRCFGRRDPVRLFL
jgi:hypothetical protein